MYFPYCLDMPARVRGLPGIKAVALGFPNHYLCSTHAMNMEFSRTTTLKGADCIIKNGFKYRFMRKMVSGDKDWRCTKKNCKSRIQTDVNVVDIKNSSGEHGHPALDDRELNVLDVRQKCIRKATEEIHIRPRTISSSVLATANITELKQHDLENFRQAMYRSRRKTLPPMPKSREESISQLTSTSTLTKADENFVHPFKADEMVIVTCQKNLDFLKKHSSVILVDGTFYTSPRYFQQLYTIHVYHNSVYCQITFVFLPNKNTACYMKMWENLESLIGPGFLPELFLVDFEEAAHIAIRSKFPSATIKCCRFHLGQSWYRKILELGLSNLYKEISNENSKWLKLFFGLPLLDAEEIDDAFLDLMTIAPQDELLMRFSEEGWNF
uniref:MULE transposase domain-containing protein n=1 Tax=Cacopsylla melanoneura TaxID=428564 RepID=A0A8D9FI09_9HEMI